MNNYQSIHSYGCDFNFRKVTRAITMFFDQILEKEGIRSTQFTVLITLTASHGKNLSQIAESLIMERTTLSRNLKILEKYDFIIIKKIDGRSKGYIVNDKGHKIIERVIPLWKKAQNFIVDKFGEVRYDNLLKEIQIVCNIAIEQIGDKNV